MEQQRRLAELANPFQPDVEPTRPVRGNHEAPITIIEYSDFYCPYCGPAYQTVKRLMQRYPDRLRLIYKHNPLDSHPMAQPAARYFEAIALQSHEQAWVFHDRVFEQQSRLQQGRPALQAIVAALHIDHPRLEQDLVREGIDWQIKKDRAEARKFGFDGTPAFVINGVSLRGAYPEEEFLEVFHLVSPEGLIPTLKTPY